MIYQIYHKSLQLTNLLIPYHDHLLLQVIQVKKHHLVYHHLWLHQIYQNMLKTQLLLLVGSQPVLVLQGILVSQLPNLNRESRRLCPQLLILLLTDKRLRLGLNQRRH
uniref:Uncharacterized protein n=1 Tax=Rhizophagus irregularis (strain DAOM 181602 / DAOM 197198 / MUCL 43194) TaxID=747089 RepID=U9TZN4_RHIID